MIFCGLIICFAGCGYTLVGQGSLPKHIKTIAIPIFTNKTLEKGVEDIITQAIIEKFVKDGKVRLVSETEADALVTGSIQLYKSDEAMTYNEQNEIASYKLVVKVNVELRDLVNDKVLWEMENLTEDDEFAGGPDVNPTQEEENEEKALKELADELAQRVLSLSVEGF